MSKTLSYGQPVTLAAAKHIAAAAESVAHERGLKLVVTVLDSAAQIVLVHRMEHANYGSVAFAFEKARTAVNFKRPSKFFEDMIADGGSGLRMLGNAHVSPLEGGVPIVVGDAVLGSIGVSGATSAEDGELANLALGAFLAWAKEREGNK
ncbi:GlcG/HbpS family heme-binding protein [Rugamonas aquatica]|uniref:Heme-binding protein n=1 Tax=Rugamonas aquatica TaxID=2743357 RepID=A0A6A7MU89_9BURK|nr:heme-binding protein [Rugamonas aquatica]MQA36687.1 heme-binding protein [Rugamonas aquatica]